jgi:thiamine transporter ThiT
VTHVSIGVMAFGACAWAGTSAASAAAAANAVIAVLMDLFMVLVS